jgi:pantothenate kinase
VTEQDITQNDLASLLVEAAKSKRVLVAIAGPPGVGKSTFSRDLCERLNASQQDLCAMLPMDGFHFDDIYLKEQGWHARKGAPHTFDVDGLASMLDRLRAEREEQVAIPIFDRQIEVARAGAAIISRASRIILVEGNYLLLDEAPWANLSGVFDFTLMISASEKTLVTRLSKRWLDFGYSRTEIEQRVAGNDLINIRSVINGSRSADFLVFSEDNQDAANGRRIDLS